MLQILCLITKKPIWYNPFDQIMRKIGKKLNRDLLKKEQ